MTRAKSPPCGAVEQLLEAAPGWVIVELYVHPSRSLARLDLPTRGRLG